MLLVCINEIPLLPLCFSSAIYSPLSFLFSFPPFWHRNSSKTNHPQEFNPLLKRLPFLNRQPQGGNGPTSFAPLCLDCRFPQPTIPSIPRPHRSFSYWLHSPGPQSLALSCQADSDLGLLFLCPCHALRLRLGEVITIAATVMKTAL
jgi:hypothetical protein